MHKKIQEESAAMLDTWQPSVKTKILWWANNPVNNNFIFKDVPKFCKDRNLHQAILDLVREGFLHRTGPNQSHYIYTLVPSK